MKKVNKTTSITIRLSEADRELIRKQAAEAGLSVTDYLIRLVIKDSNKTS